MTGDNKLLRLIYTLFLGILLAIFVGVGINTFYAPPPEPATTDVYIYKDQATPEQIEKQKANDETYKQYQEELKPYNRNVSIIALCAAVLLLAVSIVFEQKLHFLADGVMLGGVFTLIYSIGRGFASQDSKYVFVVVTIALAAVIYLGYRRFVTAHELVKKS